MTTTCPKEITLEFLRSISACSEAIQVFVAQDERDTFKILNTLIKQQRWDWFRWLAPRLMTHGQKVQWAIFCAEQVLDIFEKKYPKDDRPRKAIEAARAWLKNPTEKNKHAAAAAAAAAYAAADAAAAAAYAAAAAAYAAADAAAAAAAAYAAADARNKMRIICAKEAIRILEQSN